MHTHTYTLQQDEYLMSLEYPSAEFAHGQHVPTQLEGTVQPCDCPTAPCQEGAGRSFPTDRGRQAAGGIFPGLDRAAELAGDNYLPVLDGNVGVGTLRH